MVRFFVEKENILEDRIVITSAEDIKHISKSLRLSPGERVMVSDNTEWEYLGEITEIESDKVILAILDKQKFARESRTRITLFQSIPKQGKMETIIQKSVELGVAEIVPIFTQRTIMNKKDKLTNKLVRWNKVALEASKQSGRGMLPPVVESELNPEDYDLLLIPYEGESRVSLKDVLRNLESKPETIAMVIGPEGGFSEQEVERYVALGAKAVTLGGTILRTETAAPAAIAMILYELEL